MMELKDFYNLHRGGTCLIAGVGPNLELTPPSMFKYPSFGVNTIFRYRDWKPTYYVGVDERLKVENGKEVFELYRDVPKFIPAPDWDDLPGENVYRFKHRPGGELTIGGQSPLDIKSLTEWGITYFRIMDAVFQIAAWMGFTTMLMIGIQHKPELGRRTFWGVDEGETSPDFEWEEYGYQYFSATLPVKILNISEDTYVPKNALARDYWRNWINT